MEEDISFPRRFVNTIPKAFIVENNNITVFKHKARYFSDLMIIICINLFCIVAFNFL